jgi:SAM-dependent methyltransferase
MTEKAELGQGKRVLEIGCNSGRLLELFHRNTGCEVLGIEPSKTFVTEWSDLGLPVINDYFGSSVIHQLPDEGFDLIFFRHVFEHVPDVKGFVEALSMVCRDDTLIAIEVPYLPTVIKKRRIDNISYSHLNYFSARSINEVAKMYGLQVNEYELVDTDGGSAIFYLSRSQGDASLEEEFVTSTELSELAEHVQSIRTGMQTALADFRSEDVVGYGAGAKGQHLIHMLGLEEHLSCVVDDTVGLHGTYVPGTRLEVLNPAEGIGLKTKAIVNLVPTHPEAIKSKIPSGVMFIDPINGTL